MKLLDYLKVSAGEGSLSSKLGVWRQKVSSAVDALVASSFDPAYIEVVRRNSVQTIADLAAATTILFDSTASQKNLSAISYNPATGEFTLQPGAYELDARVDFEGFDTVATDIAQFHWEDSLGFDLGQGALGLSVPPASGQNLAPQPTVKAYLDILSTTVVKLVSAGGQGGADVSVGSHASVMKVG